MVVRLLPNGAFRVVTEEAELQNHSIGDGSDSDTDNDDEEEVKEPEPAQLPVPQSPVGHGVTPSSSNGHRADDATQPGPATSPAHGNMSPAQHRHRRSKMSLGESLMSAPTAHDSPSADKNQQGKRSMRTVNDQPATGDDQMDGLPPVMTDSANVARQLIPQSAGSDHTVGSALGPQTNQGGSMFQQCPGCFSQVPRHSIGQHAQFDCKPLMSQEPRESSHDNGDTTLGKVDKVTDDAMDTSSHPRRTSIKPTDLLANGDIRTFMTSTDVGVIDRVSSTGAASGGNDNYVVTDDTGSTDIAAGADTADATSSQADSDEDTGHDDLSRSMRQPQSIVDDDQRPPLIALLWQQTSLPAGPWSRPITTGTVIIEDHMGLWMAAIRRSINKVKQPAQRRRYINPRVVRDSMIAVGVRAVLDITTIAQPTAINDMDDTTAARVEAALTAASLTSFFTDAFVKAGINAIAEASASVTLIRETRAAAAKQLTSTDNQTTRAVDESQLPACVRAAAKARGDTGAERIE